MYSNTFKVLNYLKHNIKYVKSFIEFQNFGLSLRFLKTLEIIDNFKYLQVSKFRYYIKILIEYKNDNLGDRETFQISTINSF